LLSSSSTRNALPKVGGGRPPRNLAPTPRFHVGVVVILRCDAAAVVALPILPPNEQCADVDPRHRCRRGHRTPPPPRRGAVIATIEGRRIPSARRRRESSRRRRGFAPSHPSHSSSSVAAVAAVAADASADGVPYRVLVVRPPGPSQMMVGVAVPPERPARRTHPDSGDRGSGDGGGKNGVGGGSSPGRDNDLRCRRRSPSPSLSSWGGDCGRDNDDGEQKGGRGDGEATARRRRGDGEAMARR
jgi:hypothetical protein